MSEVVDVYLVCFWGLPISMYIHKTDNIFASGDKARSKASLKKNGKIQVNQVKRWEMNGFLSFRYPIALTTGGRTTEPHSPASLVVVVWFHFFDDL